MLKVVNIVGARPNFMKVAPLIREMKRREHQFAPLLVHTGQHYDTDMSDAFFRDLQLPSPDVHLEVGSASREAQLNAVEQRLVPVLEKERPDFVVVVGDVNSTLAGARAAMRLGVKIAHVEAGLRSFDTSMPEEINRVETDRLADLLLTPSADANENLIAEKIDPDRIRLVGNIMIDSLLEHLPRARQSKIKDEPSLKTDEYAVLTLHRPNNVDDPKVFTGILEALEKLADRIAVVFPAHPRTRKNIAAFGLAHRLEQIRGLKLIEPLGYLDFLSLFSSARLVLTDSGGIQEETTVLGIPCLTLRENTERPITVTLGTNQIVGSDPEKIVNAAFSALQTTAPKTNAIPFWDGKTAERIIHALLE